MIWEGWRLHQTGRKAIKVAGQLMSAVVSLKAPLSVHTTGASILRVGVRAPQQQCVVVPVGDACPAPPRHLQPAPMTTPPGPPEPHPPTHPPLLAPFLGGATCREQA